MRTIFYILSVLAAVVSFVELMVAPALQAIPTLLFAILFAMWGRIDQAGKQHHDQTKQGGATWKP